MASSRFPGKPLVDIGGVPLVIRSARRALAADCFAQVVVATEDQVIADVCSAHSLASILTPPFPTGTDRVAWAARQLDAPWVLNLQGDEPVFPLDLLRDLCDLLPTDPGALWTAADTGLTASDRLDEDVVKIELGEGDPAEALDFFRDLPAEARERNFAIHVGVYGGSLEALSRFSTLPIPPLETLRRIEPLRALAHGMPVRARKGHWARAAIDRREHISTVLRMLEGVT
jgi:3-deoxy-manno-octulosonate cytidylyltransferase (CMP-KDO synthetase)